MQQLIDKYKKEAKKVKSPTIKYLLEMVLDDIKEMKLLEEEKQMVVDAYHESQLGMVEILHTLVPSLHKPNKDDKTDAEQYYKETYEQWKQENKQKRKRLDWLSSSGI